MRVSHQILYEGKVTIREGHFINNVEVWIGTGLESDRWKPAARNLIKFLSKEPVYFTCDSQHHIEEDVFISQAFATFKDKLDWTRGLIIALNQVRPSLAMELLRDPKNLDLQFFLRSCGPSFKRNINLFNPKVRELVAEYLRMNDQGRPQKARITKVQNILTWVSSQIGSLRTRHDELERQLREVSDWATTFFAINLEYALDSLTNKKYVHVEPANSSLQSLIPDFEDRTKFAFVEAITRLFADRKFYFVCKDNESYNKNEPFQEGIRRKGANLVIVDLEIFDQSFTLEELALAQVAVDTYDIIAAKDQNAIMVDGCSIMTGGGLVEFSYSNREIIVRYSAPTRSDTAGIVAETLRERLHGKTYGLDELLENRKKLLGSSRRNDVV